MITTFCFRSLIVIEKRRLSLIVMHDRAKLRIYETFLPQLPRFEESELRLFFEKTPKIFYLLNGRDPTFMLRNFND